MSNPFSKLDLGSVLGGLAFFILPVAVFAPKGLAPLIVATALVAAIHLARTGSYAVPARLLILSLGAMAVLAAVLMALTVWMLVEGAAALSKLRKSETAS